MIEKSRCRIGVRRSHDGFGYVTAMTMAEPAMNAYLADRRATSLTVRGLPAECDDTAYWREADHRRALLDALLDEARQKPTLDGLRRIMQHRSERGRVSYEGDRLRPDGPPAEHTLRTAIWVLNEGRIVWWKTDGSTPVSANPMPDVTDAGTW
jgi:hypothetical protein